jgi:hypothetical protein
VREIGRLRAANALASGPPRGAVKAWAVSARQPENSEAYHEQSTSTGDQLDDGDRAARIIQDALGNESDDVVTTPSRRNGRPIASGVPASSAAILAAFAILFSVLCVGLGDDGAPLPAAGSVNETNAACFIVKDGDGKSLA